MICFDISVLKKWTGNCYRAGKPWRPIDIFLAKTKAFLISFFFLKTKNHKELFLNLLKKDELGKDAIS